MAERFSQSLQGSGQQMMNSRATTPRLDASRGQTPRSARESQIQARASSSQQSRRFKPLGQTGNLATDQYKDMSVEEMEVQLTPRMHKRPIPGRSGDPPLSARDLLEENKLLIQMKKDQKALKRKNSREFVQKLLEEDRLKTEGLKVTDLGKKTAQKELAADYQFVIAQNEQTRAEALRAERSREHATYFPFVEGENIVKGREQKSAKLREEMRGFLNKQREERPPRNDSLIQDTKQTHKLLYDLSGKDSGAHATTSLTPPPTAPSMESRELKLVEEPSAHMARHPVFLTKAKEHMSRRLTDGHVRKALEQKVEDTKQELLQLSKSRQGEVHRLEDSMLVADALRYDSGAARADERRRHATFLKEQIAERRQRKLQEKANANRECAGYWGPEDKAPVDVGAHRAHCSDLIKQMEVDHHRKVLDRDARLKVEKKMIDNCLMQIEVDRAVEQQKYVQQREVLVTTWASQQKIKKAMKTIDRIT